MGLIPISCWISFDAACQDKHNEAIFEAVALFIEKLLINRILTSDDLSWPHPEKVRQTKKKLVTYRYIRRFGNTCIIKWTMNWISVVFVEQELLKKINRVNITGSCNFVTIFELSLYLTLSQRYQKSRNRYML